VHLVSFIIRNYINDILNALTTFETTPLFL
jgi:hypothetical protein